MKLAVALVCTLFCGAAATNTLSKTHPITSIITMLEGKIALVKEQGTTEEDAYNKYVQWCSESSVTLKKSIADGKEFIEEKGDEIDSLSKKITALTTEITQLGEYITDLQGRKVKADAARAATAQEYTATQNSLGATIAALETALGLMVNASVVDEGFRNANFLQMATEVKDSLRFVLDATQFAELEKVEKADMAQPNLDPLDTYKKMGVCGGEYEVIKDAGECEKAEKILGLDNGSPIQVLSNQASRHTGCMKDMSTGTLTYMDPDFFKSEFDGPMGNQFDLCKLKESAMAVQSNLVGGCAGTQFQCCPDGTTAKADPIGTNCKVPDVMGDAKKFEKKYGYKSGGVIELLKDLVAKFKKEKQDSTDAETNSLNSYNLAEESRSAQETEQTRIKGERETTKSQAEQDKTAASEDKKSAEEDLAADEVTMTETRKDCYIKGSQYKERSATQATEIKALSMAIQILEKVTGVRSEMNGQITLPPAVTLAQGDVSATNFLQVGSIQNSTRISPKVLDRVASMLKLKSSTLHSKALAWLARNFAEAPRDKYFGNAIDMIMKMIWKLEDEQKADIDHKYWCDQEMSKNKIIFQDKLDKEDDANSLLGIKKAELSGLLNQITAAQEKITQITETMKKATEIRYINKKENAKTVEDAQEAQKALSNAITVLTDYYKSSGAITKEPWEFVQAPVQLPANPDTWDASYTGASTDPNDASAPEKIIEVLTQVTADFAQTEEDTKAQEVQDQMAFDELKKDSDVERMRQETDIRMKNTKKDRLVEKIAETTTKLKNAATETRAAIRYTHDLAEACEHKDLAAKLKQLMDAHLYAQASDLLSADKDEIMDQAQTNWTRDSVFGQRQAARLEEIEALKTAKAIIYNSSVNIATVTSAPIEGPTLPPVPIINITNSSNGTTLYGYLSPMSPNNGYPIPGSTHLAAVKPRLSAQQQKVVSPAQKQRQMLKMAEDATDIFRSLNQARETR